MEKKLYRNLDDKMLCGVCSGVADYFNVDANIVRIIWAVFTFLYGIGLIAYIAAALILPAKSN